MITLMSTEDVCRALCMHRATLYRKVKAGEIIRPMKDGSRSKWHKDDIEAYINRLSLAREALTQPANQPSRS